MLKPEPERRALLGPTAIGTLDNALDALAGKQIVGEMHFLEVRALPDKTGEGLGADIVEAIFEELQDPEFLAPPTDLKHRVKSLGRQTILREVHFLVQIIVLLRKHLADVAIGEPLL